MCGIVGIVRKDGSRIDSQILQHMTDALAHRGPDGGGLHISNNVGLGHRRLSIIDPSGGSQPLSNEDGTVWITFNGEIYNHRELRIELIGCGHNFRTNSDTEVIVHAYEQWGSACVERFRGMFAFAIYDENSGTLFLARDHFGMKPLFYLDTSEYFAFASEIQAFMRLPNQKLDVDLTALDEYLWLQYIPAPRTIFEQIKKLPPANSLTVSRQGRLSALNNYWDFAFRPNYGRTEDEWVQALDEVLEDSVRAHLLSDVPFGVFLSGGVDSSLILAYMTKILNRPVKAFSIGFDEPEFDEVRFAKLAAKQYGAEHHIETVRPDALTILPDLVRHYGEPFGDSSAIPTYYVSKMTRASVPMVLSGDGADESFGGYWSYRDFLWEYAQPEVRGELYLSNRRFADDYRLTKNDPNLSDWLKFINYTTVSQRSQLWNSEYRHHCPSPLETFQRSYSTAKSFSLAHRVQYMDMKSYLPNDMLVKVDVASMMHGLEVRPPFVDLRVVNLALSIPEKFNLAALPGVGWERKLLLKRLAQKYYPADFVQRPKMGFAVPVKKWFAPEGELYHPVRETLLARDASISRFFDQTQISQLIEQGQSGPVWLFLFLEEWLKQHGI